MRIWIPACTRLLRTIRSVIGWGAFLCVATGCNAQDNLNDLLSFSVVSTRVLREEEALQRSGDSIGPNVMVRLRLENKSKLGVLVYVRKGTVVPMGFQVTFTNGKAFWFHGKPGKDMKDASPGLGELDTITPGGWVVLHPNVAIEWEVPDSSAHAREKHAITVFVKHDEKEQPREMFSEEYIVPST